ncbi:hypothetical protein [Paraburkholderia aspalathi]|uniref:Uncharacterized protein n=1 Tax=Paraburkholderia aspalathi TaxID=1324617 RepID=A0A1I7CLV6_9BURK|nr:hypothetical protein [Paraburkholderia aspalathi]SFU00402.1 hypothetical protein SAMN05192563_100711 [Paraburkholderia aspalathi]
MNSKQIEIENMSQNQESTPNSRKGNVIWSAVVLGTAAVSAALWLVFVLPGRVALVTGCSAVFATAFAVAPYVRFIDHGWWTRYDEFRNQLWEDALSEYLWQFWHRRGEDAKALQYFSGGKPIVETDEAKQKRWANAGQVFEEIYKEQYGLQAFVIPLGFLLVTILFGAHYVVLVNLRDLLPADNDVFNLIRKMPGHEVALSVSAICGAYLFVVGDCVDSVRKRILNVADVYWYSLRTLLAVPIAAALTFALPDNVAVNVAFALGVLPVAFINKQLRRMVGRLLKSGDDEEPDQLIKLEGVTGPIVSLLNAEGVTSIEQLLGMDPVLLAIQTGLPFRFVLRLGAQAVVRRHFGDSAFALTGLGLSDATSIYCLIHKPADPDAASGDGSKVFDKIVDEACVLLQGISKATWPQPDGVRLRLLEVANFAYTHFLMAAGFDRVARPPASTESTTHPPSAGELEGVGRDRP